MSILILRQRLLFLLILITYKFISIICKTIPSGLTIKCIKAIFVGLPKSKQSKTIILRHQKTSELNHNLRSL